MSALELLGMFAGLPVTMRLVGSLADGTPFDEIERAAVEYVAMADVAECVITKQAFTP